jgi:peroxidase
MRRLVGLASLTALVGAVAGFAGAATVDWRQQASRASAPTSPLAALFPDGVRTLDGSGNNAQHPEWGAVGSTYARVAPAAYADGVARMAGGPPARYVSNRIFNDLAQNLFSENGVTQWTFTWGQFLDHTFGLRQTDGERAPIAFDPDDPLEAFEADTPIEFRRTPAAPGTGASSPREQMNTVSSYIDAWSLYGGSAERLEWLREGPVDGDLSNNGAHLLTAPRGYLPRADARGDATAAPAMELQGRLAAYPAEARVAGDVRANENALLTSVHTLFAREHNRIVDALPRVLSEQVKFEIARRVVAAELQYVTYNEFLPALGVELAPYRGYDPAVNPSLSNEFAVVGYRAHSMIHGEIEPRADAADYTDAELDALREQGVEVEAENEQADEDEDAEEDEAVERTLTVPLNVAFGNPGLVPAIGLDAFLAGLADEAQYRNDEQIDNQLRSVLFQVPGPGVRDPSECLDGPKLPECFTTVLDLGALDIQRGRDHGIPSYNDVRAAYGLERKRSFAEITGEATEEFGADPEVDRDDPIDDPDILDFVELLDRDGNPVEPESEEADETVVTGRRRTTLAARLKAIYGDADRVDAFVGMMAEPHVTGAEMGELQLAMWKRQFEALRDGDRFFYLNDPSLETIRQRFGIDYRKTLREIIVANTNLEESDLQSNVFKTVAS